MKKTRILYGLFFVLLISFFILLVAGCSKGEPVAADPYPEMPDNLRLFQGTWVPATTNCCDEGRAIFAGYTIRIRYQQDADSPLIKHNASIDRVDTQRNLIILNGGTKAWSFDYRVQAGTELLDLEFFSQTGWHKILLKRESASPIPTS